MTFVGLFVLLAGLVGAAAPSTFAEAVNGDSITCEELRNAQMNGQSPTILDVRSAAAHQRAHIKGAVSAPYERLEKTAMQKGEPIVAYCTGLGCSMSNDAAIVLKRKGYTNVRVLLGGFAEWELKGYPVVREVRAKAPVGTELLKGKEVTASEARKFIGRVQVVDVRPTVEFEAGHIPGALSLPLEKLPQEVDRLSGEVLVVDRLPGRWKKAVEILTKEGRFAHAVAGGIGAWSAMGHPLEVGDR